MENDRFDETKAIKLVIDGVLDLHAFSPKDIKTLIPEYVYQCHSLGILEIRIIHGKGVGNLRRSVHALLDRNPLVKGYKMAGLDAGSWGATLVSLKPQQLSEEKKEA